MVAKGLADFSSYERGLNEVFTLLPNASAEAMADIDSQIQAFSARFGTLSTEVVPALYQALSAGVPQDNVFAFLEVAQKAAIAGATDVETAVDGITSAVNAYGADTLSAQQASDMMFRAVVLGKTTFEELSASMFNVLPVAASLGVGFEDVNAAIAAITAQGVPTSVATTQIRGALEELADSSTDAGKAFEHVAGQSFREFIAGGGDMAEAMSLIEQASRESGVPLNEMFSRIEAANAVLALTGEGAETFATFLDDVTNSAGATDAAFDQMNQGIGRAMDRLFATFQNLSVNIGRVIAPVVEPFIRGFSDVVQVISNVISGQFGVEALGDALGEVPALFRPVLRVLMPLAAGFRQLAIGIGYAIEEFSAGEPLFEVFEALFIRIADAMGFSDTFVEKVGNIGAAVGTLITNLSNSMGIFDSFALFIGNIVAVLTGNNELGTKIVSSIVAIGDAISDIVTPIMDFIAANVELQDVLVAVGIAIGSFLIATLASIVAAAAPVIATFAVLVGAVALIRNAWENDWGGIQEKVQSVIDFFKNEVVPFFTGLWDAIQQGGIGAGATFIYDNLIAPLLTQISEYIGGGALWEDVKALGASIFDALKTGIPVVATWVTDNIINPLVTNITSMITTTDWSAVGQSIMDGIGNVLSTLSDWGTWVNDNLIAPLVNKAIEFFQTTDWSAVGSAILSALGTAISLYGDYLQWLNDHLFQPLLDNAQSAIEGVDWSAVGAGIVNAVGAALKATFDFVAWIIDSIFNPVTENAEGATEGVDWGAVGTAIMNAIGAFFTGVFDFISWLYETIFLPLSIGAMNAILQTDWSAIGQGLMDAIGNALPDIVAWVNTHIIQPITNALSDFSLTDAINLGGDILGGISGAAQSAGEWIGQTIQGFQFGGEAQAGQPITVGHGGIETFIPNMDGQILSAAETASNQNNLPPITINFYFQRGVSDTEARDSAYKVKRELQAQGINVEGNF